MVDRTFHPDAFGELVRSRRTTKLLDPETTIVWPEFDPYSPNGQLTMARIDALIDTGQAIASPQP